MSLFGSSQPYPKGFERRTRLEFERLGDVPAASGLYVWKFNGIEPLNPWMYHYVGQAPCLNTRLNAHVGGNSQGSRLRRALAHLLAVPARRSFFGKVSLPDESEQWLTDWMKNNGACWYYETNAFKSLERGWIKSLGTPMNAHPSEPLSVLGLEKNLGRKR